MAATSDCIIFLFLGLVLIEEEHYYHQGFIISTIIFCLIFRFASTFLFSFIVNIGRMDKISLKEQFIMAYGGLRGAVGFSLAMVIKVFLDFNPIFCTKLNIYRKIVGTENYSLQQLLSWCSSLYSSKVAQ